MESIPDKSEPAIRSFEIVRCQSCGVSVVPERDGSCPSCQRLITSATHTPAAEVSTTEAGQAQEPPILQREIVCPTEPQESPQPPTGRRGMGVGTLIAALILGVAGGVAGRLYGGRAVAVCNLSGTPVTEWHRSNRSEHIETRSANDPTWITREDKLETCILLGSFRLVRKEDTATAAFAEADAWRRPVVRAITIAGGLYGVAIVLWFGGRLWRHWSRFPIAATFTGAFILMGASHWYLAQHTNLNVNTLLSTALVVPLIAVALTVVWDLADGRRGPFAQITRGMIRALVGLLYFAFALLALAAIVIKVLSGTM